MVKKNRAFHNILILSMNIILIAIVSSGLGFYSNDNNQKNRKQNMEKFIDSVESMKSISLNYLNSEKGYVNNWANYINDKNFTLKETLNFLREINTNSRRIAHIVDMGSYEAYSSFYSEGNEKIITYSNLLDYEGIREGDYFKKSLIKVYNDDSSSFSIVSVYKINEFKDEAISVGRKISLLQEDNTKKDYLLLRVIPVRDIKENWEFPKKFESAEIGIISRAGNYIIKSNSMKNSSFIEYIRAYNFPDDYNKKDEVYQILQKSEKGLLNYKNFRNKDCIWYYSTFEENSDFDVLGMVYEDEILVSNDDWMISLVISGTVLLLGIIDGIYLFYVNKKLKKTAEQANIASAAKTQFLSAMSHDIRTPLNAVLGMIHIAKNNIDNKEYAMDCLDKSTSAGKQLLTVINDVLDISKIESGKLSLNYATFSLQNLFDGLNVTIESTAKEKEMHYTYNLSKLENPYVICDKGRLEQVCMNLLSNAIKYTHDGGNISLTVYEEKSIYPSKTRLVIKIKDNGMGMSEEYQKTMYQSFSRAVNTRVNAIQGTGLGLYIVKLVIDQMGGTIECDSKLNVGTEFTVKLDLEIVGSPKESDNKEKTKLNSIEGLNLLIAEDNILNSEIIETMLTEFGAKCTLCENGSLCVDKLFSEKEGTYDAILMDIHMPVMNGIEATRKIRKEGKEGIKDIPIIAMTADAFQEDIENCFKEGMNGHIAKPIDIKKLLEVLNSINR